MVRRATTLHRASDSSATTALPAGFSPVWAAVDVWEERPGAVLLPMDLDQAMHLIRAAVTS